MGNIVFINPAVDKYAEVKLWASELMDYVSGKQRTVLPRLAPMIMKALTPEKYNFTFIDEEVEDIDFDNINADLVAITSMTIQANRAYEIAAEFRKRGVTVIMGGIHVSVLPDEALLHADAVCIGEGENVWPEMLKDFEAGELKPKYDAKDYPPVEELVTPCVDIIKPDHYSMFPVMATKGCPYECDFCSIKYSSGSKIRMKPVSQVMKEIQDMERHNTGLFKKGYQFVDDNLYINREYTKELFTELKKQNIFWQGQGTLNTVKDDEIIQLMAESGCRSYSIGFESISEASLKEVNKSSNQIAEYENAIQKLIKHGITPAGFFIFGFDSDDKTVFEKTLAYIKNTRILNPYFSILTPYPGTRVYKRVEERIFDHKWSRYGAVYSVYTPTNMTPEELMLGTHWISREVADIDTIKSQLEYFWSQGPWKTNPGLKLKERIALIAIALKLGRKEKYKVYRRFLLWAATHKKAVDPYMIVTAIVFNEVTQKQFKDGRNPAESTPIEASAGH